MESKGFTVAVFNRTTSRVDDFVGGRAKGKNIIGTHSLEELCKETRGKEDEVASQLQKLQEKLTVFGFSWNGQDDLPPVISERIEAYKRQLLLFSGFEKQQGELNAKLAGLKGELQGKEEALRRAQSQVEKTDKELALTHKKRQDEYQDKKTKDERSTLETEYTKALTQKDKATSAFATASAELKTAENSIENLTRQINDRQEEFTRRQLECDRVLRENNLTVETYRNTLLANDEFERLVSKERELIESRKHLDKDIREQAEKKEKHLKQLPKDFNVQEAQNQLKALEDKQTELARESGGIQQILDSNKKHLAQAEKLQNERNAIQIEHDRWVKLNSWLGGQKFKQLAQAYTFDALLIKANEQLQNMLNGRYQMCPHIENDKLEIDVIDNLLGGDIRTSKNLSGGEQFIISMSLALGLANMVGEKLRIESLFLDEGFGTLDGNELEEAMKTLSQLKGDGKLVGIITHAERLQERISTRISIEKQGNGRSNLDGPGVTFKAKPTIFIRKEKETPSNDRQRK